MAKAFVVIKHVELRSGKAVLYYAVTLERDTPQDSNPDTDYFSQDFKPDSRLSMKANEDFMKAAIADYAGSIGVKISTGDVIIYGAPVVKDSISFTDSTKGITSDNTAVVKVSAEEAQPTLTARFMSGLRSAMNA